MANKTHDVRMSLQTMKVLDAFLARPTEEISGSEIHQQTGLASGTLYPILLRLESAGWLTSEWEDVSPADAGRPRRRLYRITHSGKVRASEVFAELRGGLTA